MAVIPDSFATCVKYRDGVPGSWLPPNLILAAVTISSKTADGESVILKSF